MAEERSAKRPRYNEPPQQQRGSGGSGFKEVTLTANYFRVQVGLNQNIIVYDIKIQPDMENFKLISKLLRPHEKVTGPLIVNKLLAYSLIDFGTKTVESDLQDKKYTITLIKSKVVSRSDSPQIYFQVFNSAFRRILQGGEGLVPLGKRALFDKSQRTVVDRYRFEIWPGYMTTLNLSSNGEILICTNLVFKILRKETVYDIVSKSDRHEDANLKGSIVLTSYGRKDRTYRIKDIRRDMTPDSTFERKGVKISFREYYKQVYNEDIRHRDQPLILAESATERRQKRKNIALTAQEEPDIYLIPELCTLTGITDAMRSNHDITGTISKTTRIGASQRLGKIEEFMRKFTRTSNPYIKKYLSDWKIQVEDRSIELQGKVIEPQTIFFANDAPAKQNEKADWSAFWKDKLKFVKTTVMRRWLVIYNERDQVALGNLLKFLPKIGNDFGMNIDANPVKIPIHNDQVQEWKNILQKNISGMDFIICILPRNTTDKYNAIKKFLTGEIGIPSQCIVAKTLQDDKVQSAVTKIAQQINSKLGGSVWKLTVDLPPGPTMICGIDVCHDKISKRGSVAGFVATVNRDVNSFFSKTIILQREADLVTGLTQCMKESIQYFNKLNSVLPANIIVYRDGVGDSQLPTLRETEIQEVRTAFKSFEQYNPSLIFIVVQKRINTRLFTSRGQNPSPGTVVDHTITSPIRGTAFPEFYLIPQFVQGSATVCPSHYIILENDLNAQPAMIQILTFRLCHLYYNWSGTIRVPAPVQYAQKLSFHVSQHLGRENHPALTGKLFYL